jgi:hypothetical protein
VWAIRYGGSPLVQPHVYICFFIGSLGFLFPSLEHPLILVLATSDITRTWSIPSKLVPGSCEDLELTIHEPGLTEGNTGHKTWGTAFALITELASHKTDTGFFAHMFTRSSARRILEYVPNFFLHAQTAAILVLDGTFCITTSLTILDLDQVQVYWGFLLLQSGLAL